MPIRMREDEPGSSSQKRSTRSSSSPRSGGGIGGGLLGALLPLLLRNPKLLLIVGVIAALLYFFGGKQLFSSASQTVLSGFSQGATLDQTVFDEAEVFAPLSEEGNTLPERVSLEEFCPTAKNQGQQGSCVGWGSAYAARTILEARATGKNPNEVAFSPAFLYNQIKLDGCQGSYIYRAVENMTQVGALPFSNFGYTDESCNREPNRSELQSASRYKMKGANRLTKDGNDYTIDFLAIKQNLAQGAPVIIGMMVGQSFMQPMTGQKIWQPTDADYDMQGLGGHCMCVIGYDDYLEGGAFQLMNSWGTEWGINGNCYVKYADFAHFTKEAYGVYPMGEVKTPEPTALELAFDLVPNGTKTGLALTQIDEHTFRTKQPLALGTAFKVRISNNAETYIYIFGEETDGSNYVLFPYTPKHSPYCGITGTRIFPKDYSMEVDAKGTRDVMAVVVSQQPIDFNKLNDALNSQKGKKFGDRLRTVLNDELADAQLQTTPQGLSASRMLDSKNAMFWVVEVDK